MKKLFVILFVLALTSALFAVPGKVKWFNEDNNGKHTGKATPTIPAGEATAQPAPPPAAETPTPAL